MPGDELDKLLEELHRSEPVPDFETTWRRAERIATASRRRRGEVVRWRLLVPIGSVAALAAAAVLVFFLTAETEAPPPAGAPAPVTPSVSPLADLTAPAPWSSTFEELGSGWFSETPIPPAVQTEPDAGPADYEDTTDDETFALSLNTPGDSAYETPTDFLLELEIPSWDGNGERSVL